MLNPYRLIGFRSLFRADPIFFIHIMKKIFYTLLAGIAICCGCSSAETSLPGMPQQLVAVEFSVHPAAQRVITRTTDEDAVTDTNLYLFGQDNVFSTHLYTTSSLLRFECPPGIYRIYVVANSHADMGKLTEAQLAALTFDYREQFSDLPMSYAGEITVLSNAATQTLPAIEVRRRVAKIACTISVAPQAADIVLKSVSLCNVPRKGSLFGEGVLSESASDYTTGGNADIPAGAEARYSSVFYIPENRQGTVSGITTQREKNRDNAPAYATFLLIRAMRGERVLDYRVYLGENNTTDFNVLSNTHHTLHISVLGDNEVDTRVHGYTLTVWDDLANDACGGYCPVNPQRSLCIGIEGNTAGLSFSGELEVTEGDTDCLEFHRIGSGSYFDFEVWVLQGESYYEMSYFPQLVTERNNQLCYTVTVADEYGFSQSYNFEHYYANEIRAYVKYGNMPNGVGSVTISGALASEKIGSSQNLRAMCSEKGCTLRAIPAPGYRFAGWYKESDFKTLLSSEEFYSYVPAVFMENIFPKFEPDKRFVRISTSIPDLTFSCDGEYELDYDADAISVAYGSRCTISALDVSHMLFDGWYDGWNTSRQLLCAESSYTFMATEDRTIVPVYLTITDLGASGTANCYIAPKLRAAYRFDATIRGKGRSTTGIPATRITGGQSAAVIWETGLIRGEVIKKVEYADGKIRFATGNNYGNALIGLFDDNGNCLWSWHIWVTEYDPSITAQSYTGGRVFMDRNLGALSPTGSNTSSRGLYYQWGRKDPFVYPASGNGYTQYPVVYGSGFSYDCTDPMMGYGEMSVEFAIAHPWAFMAGIYIGDDRYDDTPDWLSSQNPNLWGNASSATVLSDAGAKSIYDPCPPGWRVPDRKAFAEADLRKASAATGYWLLFFSPAATTSYYPAGGYWDAGSFVGNGKNGYVWANAPAQYQSGTNYYKHYATAIRISAAGIEPLAQMPREKAMPVRCVRE